jgi:hypothetical protein
MTTEPSLSLRKVALLLGKIHREPNGRPDLHTLLGLLRAGELMAGFEFPGTTKVYWIQIHTSYWTGISSYKFGSLRVRRGDKFKIGTYEVRISDFVDEYIDVISQEFFSQKTDANTLLNELKKALSAAQRRYEVGVTNEDWLGYLQQHQIPAPVLQQRSSAGRPPNPSWHHLAPIIAGYMMTLDRSSHLSKDSAFIAKNVHELASKEGIQEIPAVDTIRDTISKAFARAEKLKAVIS